MQEVRVERSLPAGAREHARWTHDHDEHDHARTTTLITGGDKGLGFETAPRLKEHGHRVVIGARDTGRGHEELGVEWVQLDVTSDASVAAATHSTSASAAWTCSSTTPASPDTVRRGRGDGRRG